jgi:lysophospholipase L1-like esterase
MMSTSRLSSWLLLAGIATGFLLATWSGHATAGYSKPAQFRRFHQRISPDTLFYPPYSMLETLALARWQPGKILVIVGGNSILNGVGQPADDVWTLRLQDLLGDSYVVVNLAFRSAYPTQGAALVAESLQRRGIPLVYVTNTNPGAGTGLAAGPPYGYFYWQALDLGKLALFPAREAATIHWADSLPPAARVQLAEDRLGSRLDAWFRQQSLWHHVGYHYVFTVWNYLLRDKFWVARGRLADNEPMVRPLAERFAANAAEETAMTRGYTAGLAEEDGNGGWRLTNAGRKKVADEIEASFAPALRPRMLMLLEVNNPYHLDRLSPSDRARDTFVYDACAEIWRQHGIACTVAGRGFAPADYADRSHLSPDGGRRLAEIVAREVRQFPHP